MSGELFAWLNEHQDHVIDYVGPDAGDAGVGLSGHGPGLHCDIDGADYEVTEAEYAVTRDGRAPAMCPAGCGCRLWTEDADARDCGCDGPCCWYSWDDYLADVLERPDYYREIFDASRDRKIGAPA